MFIEKVRHTIKKYGLIKKADKVIVAVSGGADSTALLFALNELKSEYVLGLSIAHFNHMFRGAEEAKKDFDYVSALSRQLRLPLVRGRADVPKTAKQTGLSLEEAARNKRYEFLLRTAANMGASKIALGHTLDDQAETILMRLLRGTGLGGLRGIPPSRKVEDKLIIRPLIELWRSEVEEYLRNLNVRPRQDITNSMTQFLRNRIRSELIPFFSRYNPNIKEVLARSAESFTYDYQTLADLIEKQFNRYAVLKAGLVKVDAAALKRKQVGIRRGILRKAIEGLKGDLRGIDYSHIEQIENVMGAVKGVVSLPDKIRVTKEKDFLIFRKGRAVERMNPRIHKKLCVPGKTEVPVLGLLFETKFAEGKVKFTRANNVEYLDYGRIRAPLYVRTWRKGDRFAPLGMTAMKKLQNFYVDEKIPQAHRASIPLVVSGNRIIWVCGLRLSDEVKITDKTKNILRVSFKRNILRAHKRR